MLVCHQVAGASSTFRHMWCVFIFFMKAFCLVGLSSGSVRSYLPISLIASLQNSFCLFRILNMLAEVLIHQADILSDSPSRVVQGWLLVNIDLSKSHPAVSNAYCITLCLFIACKMLHDQYYANLLLGKNEDRRECNSHVCVLQWSITVVLNCSQQDVSFLQ